MATKKAAKKAATGGGRRGPVPCPECGRAPHVMQKNAHEVEVGCLAGHGRARAATRAEAVAAWNAGDYLKL